MMEFRNIILCLTVLLGVFNAIYAWGCPDRYKRYSLDHSFCLRQCCSCAFMQKDVSEGLKNEILFQHNSYRSKVAAGYSYGVNHLSRAANMLEMVWDDELAAIAQKWAYSCKTSYDCDLCRMVERFPVGQSVVDVDGKMDGKDIQMDFITYFNGLEYVTKNHLSSYKESDGKSKYTQLLWAKTWRIGCGFLYFYGPQNRRQSTLICNYGPQGNIEGEEVYKAGDKCSACPANSCCGKSCEKHGIKAKYDGLCKVIDVKLPPEGKVPHVKTGKEVFYCAFNAESDCSRTVTGMDTWMNTISNGGTRLQTTLEGGWNSVLTFTSPIKSKSGNICIKVVTRKGPTVASDAYDYKMFGSLEKESKYMTTIIFPNVDEKTKHQYQIDYIQPEEFPKNEDIKLSLSFSVPDGSPAQIFEIHEIKAEDKKCPKTTTTEGTGFIVS